jgi:hypothetical protein
MSLVTSKIEPENFPLQIFGNEIKESFESLSQEYSVPLDFFGVAGIFTIASLSGNMYRTELNGRIKSIIFAMMLGPSSLGKTIVYDKLFGDIISKQDENLRKDYQNKIKAWNEAKAKAIRERYEFTDPMPTRTIRTATNGTLEAFMKYAETNPAGFGLYFDEGKKLYSGGKYAKDNTSVEFWNEAWNGKTFNELRVDSDRERFVVNPAISILAGMQPERVNEMFNESTISSGLLNRFIFCHSDYIQLNEDVDHFSQKKEVCENWKSIVKQLFDNGCNYHDESQQIFIPFTENAKKIYNKISKKITAQSNDLIKNIKDGDESRLMIGYMGKLYAYLGRFTLICALIKDIHSPIITEESILNAEMIYNYFKNQARKLLVKISDQVFTDLNEAQGKLLNMLPDKFTLHEAKEISKELKLSDSFFYNTYNRKYKGVYIKQIHDKTYERL